MLYTRTKVAVLALTLIFGVLGFQQQAAAQLSELFAIPLGCAKCDSPSSGSSSVIVTIQQVSNDRYVDAHVVSGDDYRIVTRTRQDNDTQRWKLKDLGNNRVTIQQVSTGRYVDAHQRKDKDWRLVTRTWQNNDTQRWILRPLGNNRYTIRQVSTGRYVDAHEYSGKDYGLVTRDRQNNNTQRWEIRRVD